MKLVVIGGTAAGLSAASKARRLDPNMEIIVYEASGYVSYGACGLPYLVGGCIPDANDLISLSPQQLREQRNIPTFIHHRVKKIDRDQKKVEVCNLDNGQVFQQDYDKLVIATGAKPVIPPIPGIEGAGVYTLRTVEDGLRLRGRVAEKTNRAVIIGGGFIGLELAEQLTLAGIEVHIVEAMPRLLPMLPAQYAETVAKELTNHGVSLHLGTSVSAILRNSDGQISGVQCANSMKLPTDFVVLSVGVRPVSDLAKECGLMIGTKGGILVNAEQQTSDADIWACGDCVEMRHLITGKPCYFPLGTTANKQGRVAGENVAGGQAEFPGVLGSQVTKVFDLYLSSTGLSIEQAQQEGYSATSVSIKKTDRASYYPGGEENQLTLVFRKDSGRLLGAQGIGGGSIAGRINLLACAITSGMDVFQLNELDLVYSPSVAPVYDPILIAASQAIKKVMR